MNKEMDKANEPKKKEATTKKPKRGKKTKNQKKNTSTKKTDNVGSDLNQSDMGSQTSGASDWD